MALINDVRKLARCECASFDTPSFCLVRDADCVFYRGDHLRELPRCKWFEEAVLPADPALESKYRAELQRSEPEDGRVKHCESCGKGFKPTGNRQKYCVPCRDEQKARADRRRKKERYWMQKVKERPG